MDCSYFLDPRLCGNATSQPAYPARAAASCFIRLKWYLFSRMTQTASPQVVEAGLAKGQAG